MIRNRRLFYLKTSDRTSGDDASNFKLALDIPTHETYTYACVEAANIPKSYYLIQAGYNTFTLVELGVNITITIPPGNYNTISFMPIVSGLLTAASQNGWVYSMSMPNRTTQPDTMKFTYVVAGAHTPSFIVGSHVYEQLGFSKNSTVTFVGGTLVSSCVVKFQSEDTLYLHSDMVVDGVLQEVYTSGSPDGSIISYKCMSWELMAKRMSAGSGNLFSFTLTDEFGTVMNLNGLDWNMTLVLFNLEQPLTIKLDH
jgi:hypothetical protein